jgi:hypothetical protein
MTQRKMGSREEWLAAREELLEREKELWRRASPRGRGGASSRFPTASSTTPIRDTRRSRMETSWRPTTTSCSTRCRRDAAKRFGQYGMTSTGTPARKP